MHQPWQPPTMAPTTMAPTTMAPTTMAPTTMEPTMAPTTMAPKTMAPTTMAATTTTMTTTMDESCMKPCTKFPGNYADDSCDAVVSGKSATCTTDIENGKTSPLQEMCLQKTFTVMCPTNNG